MSGTEWPSAMCLLSTWGLLYKVGDGAGYFQDAVVGAGARRDRKTNSNCNTVSAYRPIDVAVQRLYVEILGTPRSLADHADQMAMSNTFYREGHKGRKTSTACTTIAFIRRDIALLESVRL